MKKIYTEKIHQSTRFGLIDEDGRKTPCGTLWSDAQRNTFERLMHLWRGIATAEKNPHCGQNGRTLGDRKNFASSGHSSRMRRWKSLSKSHSQQRTTTNAAQRADTMNVLTDATAWAYVRS